MTPFQQLVVRAFESGGWSLRLAEAASDLRLKRPTLSAIMNGRSWQADKRTLDAISRTLDIDRETLQSAHDATKAWRDQHLRQCARLSPQGRRAVDAYVKVLLKAES